MANDYTPNQYLDDQNFDVDIDQVYQNFIVEIDKIRSHISVQSNAISLNDTNNIGSSTNIDRDPQESRCHAFYRLIGFPVVSTDGQILYCPGFDKPNNSKKDLNDSKSLIAQKISKDVLKVMDARENAPRDFLSKFVLQDINSSVLAMSSVDIRQFASSFKSESPFDIETKNQTHISNLAFRLSNIVQDSSGNNATKIESERLHILKPFIVDPRIDLSVSPNKSRIAVPFLKDKSEVKITENVYVKRPYIEKVCRERFKVFSIKDEIGDHTKQVIQNIVDNYFIKDPDLVNIVTNPQLSSSEQAQFANYINIIRSMLKKLSDSVDGVLKVLAADPESNSQAEYNWTPIPNKNGPEFGCITRDILSQQNDPSNTKKDKDLIQLQYKQEVININNKLNAQNKADLGGFAFDNNEITPDANSSDSYGDKISLAIEELKTNRKSLTDQANDGLREIEIIMGEFSGLGLCDILAISAALWIVDKKVLINLLDNTAIERMLTDPNLQSTEVLDRKNGATMTPIDALSAFETSVKQIFELMDFMYKDIRSKNKR